MLWYQRELRIRENDLIPNEINLSVSNKQDYTSSYWRSKIQNTKMKADEKIDS